MIKTLKKLEIESNFLNLTKDVYEKPTANIRFNGVKLKGFSLRSGTRQGYLLLPLLFNIVLEILVRPVRQEKEINGIHIGKEEVKISLFTDNIILYAENPKESTKKNHIRASNMFNKVAGYKINIQKSIVLLYTNNRRIENQNNNSICNKKIIRNKFNKRSVRLVY